MSFHTYEDLCYDLASSCDPLIRGTTTTAHHEYDTNWTSRAIGRSSMITGHNASTLARPHRPFLERKVAGPSPSASCRASSADGRSQPTGIETVFRQPDSRFRPSVGTSEPRARLQRPLPSRITRTWMHPALQDESHPAAADFYILFFSLYLHYPCNYEQHRFAGACGRPAVVSQRFRRSTFVIDMSHHGCT